jgi:hypothetical protein
MFENRVERSGDTTCAELHSPQSARDFFSTAAEEEVKQQKERKKEDRRRHSANTTQVESQSEIDRNGPLYQPRRDSSAHRGEGDSKMASSGSSAAGSANSINRRSGTGGEIVTVQCGGIANWIGTQYHMLQVQLEYLLPESTLKAAISAAGNSHLVHLFLLVVVCVLLVI